MTEDEMAGWHHQLNGHESKQTLGDSGGQGSLACFSPQGCQESDTTQRLNNNIHVSVLFQILFPLKLLQNIEQSCLCFTTGPCWLSILNMAVCTCQFQTPSLSIPPFFLSLITINSFSKSVVCFCFLNKFICIIFQIPHVSHITVCLSLTSLSMILSICIHAAANGIVS